MSAVAGRVLIIPKGAYNPSSTYHMLDAVSYNSNSYLAKKTTQGNTPSADNEFWMLLSAGSAVASINDIGDVLITLPTDGQVLKYNATTQKWENGQDTGGLLPHLIIISEDGESEVKAVKGSTEIIATRTSAGHYECDVPEFGTWTIHAVLNGDDATVNLVVDTVKVYTVDDSHFHADITVNYPSGYTCSCAKSGETTLYATGSPYTFTVHSSGIWTITTTDGTNTFSKDVSITTSGQTASILLPDGETVTPTDDVQILLACAGIGDSEITTLAELLADTTTLSALISSNNAVDYLVRSTTWAATICDSSTAMTYIGLNNYCANTLLADSTWRSAIWTSAYKESVLNVKAPIMTSNNTPIGECFGDSKYDTFDYFQAFDGNSSTRWVSNVSKGNACYIGYTFPSNAKFVGAFVNIIELTSTIKYQTYVNGSWEDVSTQETNVMTNHSTLFNSVADTNKLRLYISTQTGSSGIGYAGQVSDLQFYGRADI